MRVVLKINIWASLESDKAETCLEKLSLKRFCNLLLSKNTFHLVFQHPPLTLAVFVKENTISES
jgi:hypothetical protein